MGSCTSMCQKGEWDGHSDKAVCKVAGDKQRKASGETLRAPNGTTGSGVTTPRVRVGKFELDCYPYTFSPLLLFAQGDYFDKGYSNYNAVAQFFQSVLKVNMLENVLYDSKNMLYEELLEHVVKNEMLVTCCIDAHFTAFQVLPKRRLMYYDPLKSSVYVVEALDGFDKFVCFHLLKCNYANSQHIQEQKAYYTGTDSTPTRRMIYGLWRDINKLTLASVLSNRLRAVRLDLDTYYLINSASNPQAMSTQQTGNTCYFQTYLFGVLCRHCSPSLSKDGASIDLKNIDALSDATIAISRLLLSFFVEADAAVMRPLSNSNFLLDFHRYREARYYDVVTRYLQQRDVAVPEYELQYSQVLQYFCDAKTLHRYDKFVLGGAMSSTLNTKSLQSVCGTEDGAYKLAQSNYYKYRAANLMFGFNAGILRKLRSFCEFNALRKNQLLAFYDDLRPIVGTLLRKRGVSPSPTNKYRDYYFMPQFEIAQQELVDLHHYTYELDMHGESRELSTAQPRGVAGMAQSFRSAVQCIAVLCMWMDESPARTHALSGARL